MKKKTIDVEHLRTLHGRARVDRAEWYALGRVAVLIRDVHRRTKEEALDRALAALEEAREAEECEEGWNRNLEWLVKRLDAADARRAPKTRLYVSAFDFAGAPLKTQLLATDTETPMRVFGEEEEDIEW